MTEIQGKTLKKTSFLFHNGEECFKFNYFSLYSSLYQPWRMAELRIFPVN